VVVRGRVAPLLELGAGFHPELSGRENIFLNGAILGFSRHAIEERIDQIIEFAEMQDFIESPMRTYSSGMWARLGFSVATVDRPDVLLVDEVLAVGDEAFQKRCYERILNFRDNGTTIFLVAHNMQFIQDFCEQVAWLDHGELKAVGDSAEVVRLYRDLQATRYPGR
jgi:lipopolysaccharide transport system ATP-binding protein